MLLGSLYAVFYSNSFQNWLTGKLGDYLSTQFKTKISIGHINYKPLQTFELENVLFGDNKNDTLFFAGSVSFNLAGLNLDSTEFKLSDVKVDRGYCRLVYYKDGSYNLSVLDNISNPDDTTVSTIPFQLIFNKVTCTNTRFVFKDETDTSTWEDFAPNDEYFHDINVKAHDFRVIDDSLHFVVDHLDLKEKSGFAANHLEATVTISPRCMLYEQLQLKTQTTFVNGSYAMRYDGWEAFDDYFNNIHQEAKVNTSVVDLKDVSFFASQFKDFKYKFTLKGEGRGTVSNMKLRKLDVRFGKTGIFKGRADLKGLPDIDNTFIDAEATQVIANKQDIDYLAQQPVDDEVKKFGTIIFKGNYTGFYKDFVAYGHFTTALGTAESDLNMKLAEDFDDYEYSGNLKLYDFNLGHLTGNKLFGLFTANTALKGKGLSFDRMQATINATVPEFTFNKYHYKNISIDGELNKKILKGKLLVKDEHADLDFDGLINLAKPIPEYNFKAKLTHAHLKQLNIDTAEMTLSAFADINFNWKDIDHNNGVIDVSDIEVVKGDELYTIKEFHLTSYHNNEKRQIEISSDNIDGSITGNFTFTDIPKAVMSTLSGLAPQYIDEKQYITTSTQDFNFELDIRTLYPFNELFFKNIEVKNAVAKGQFDKQQHKLILNGFMEELHYHNVRFEAITMKQNQSAMQNAELLAGLGQLIVNDTVITKDAALKISLNNNVAATQLIVKDTQSLFTANIKSEVYFVADTIKVLFENSRVSYMKSRFRIKENSGLIYHSSSLQFNDLLVTRNKDESILLNGTYGFNATPHNLKAEVENFKLNLINEFLPYLTINVNGVVNGALQLTGTNELILSSDANVNDLSLDHDTIGDFRIATNYLAQQRRLMAYLKSTNGKLRNVEFSGFYDFAHPSDALNFNIHFDESDITSFQAFVKGYITLYSGSVRAKGQLTGSLKSPELNCELDLMGVTLVVDYLKTMYSFSTRVNMNEQQISIEPTEIRDINDHKALLSGYITHKNFSNPKLNVKINNLNDFQVLNTKAKDNDLFYGTANVDGSISLVGPFNDMIMDATFTGQRGTVINIPISEGMDDGADGLLHFINRDTLVRSADVSRSGSISGFTINCMLHVTKDAEIDIVFDEQQGDKIRGSGYGDLKLELTRSGQFNMFGEVEIEEGDYRFTALNLFTKKFTLRRGGTITWTGDPLAGQMNITGVYSLRTSVGDIVSVAEKDAVSDQRIPVECLLYLRGNLLNPDIRFDMNMYDLNGSLSNNAVSEVQNLLRVWRNDNDLMTQQVVSLMLFGRFTPTNIQNQAGATSLTAGVNNTLSGFVSAQATSFIQQIIPGLDVNVDYHTGNESVRGRTILSASKRIFDNRLELQANVDPINTYQNFSTQYNLTRDGNLKAKAFSRAQADPIFNRNINTQGIGLYYRKEFDKFSDLFTRKNTTITLNP